MSVSAAGSSKGSETKVSSPTRSGSSGASAAGGTGGSVGASGASGRSAAAPAAGPAGAKSAPAVEKSSEVGAATTVRDEVQAGTPEEIANPYSFSPYAERVTAETWTKDRTPGEGQVSRDDHLIGMLENRGFTQEEIYARDEDGKTMYDRVAEANNLENPNLIQAGQSYIIPSRNEPAETHAEAAAHAQGLESAYASADTTQELGDLHNQRAEASARAEALATSGDATAIANTTQTVGNVDNSLVTARAQAEASSLTGDASALATSGQTAGDVRGSHLSNSAEASAASLTGDAVAVSGADQSVGSLVDSTLSNRADSRAETLTGEATTVAEAHTAAGPMQDSTLTNVAHIERMQGLQGQDITAATRISAEEATGAEATDRVVAGPAGSSALQEATLEGAVGPAAVDQVATGLQGDGRSDQVADVEGQGVAVSQVSDAGRVDQTAANWSGPALSGPAGAGQADLTATGSEFASQSTTGFESTELSAVGVDMAAQSSDAQTASYNLEGGRLVAYHDGKDGSVDISANANEGVFFNDGGVATAGAWTPPTGNTIRGDVRSPDMIIDAQASESVRGTFGSQGGDTRVELRLPEGAPGETPAGDAVSVPLAGGNDYLVTTGGNPRMLVEKPSGDLNLHQTELRGNDVQLAYDLGQSNLGGFVDLRGTEGADVAIRSAGGTHDVRFEGGPNSTLTLQLTGDQPPPRVVTQEAGLLPTWLGGQAEAGYLPEGSQGTIYAPGFERVVVMRGDEVVYPSPPGVQPAGFDQVAQSIQAATLAP